MKSSHAPPIARYTTALTDMAQIIWVWRPDHDDGTDAARYGGVGFGMAERGKAWHPE